MRAFKTCLAIAALGACAAPAAHAEGPILHYTIVVGDQQGGADVAVGPG